jgi:ribosomal protein L13E
LEVIPALVKQHGFSIEELKAGGIEKAEKCGIFQEKVF